jgi:ABC-2 type transport system permease protein
LIASGLGSLNVALALRTGSREAVEGSFPMFFSLLFISSAFFPRDLMSGWFKSAASLNPLSHLIEGLRVQVVEGFSASDATLALVFAVGILVVGVVVSSLSLRARLGRAA